MINGEWNTTQNDTPLVAFYDMCAVTFVLPDEMADVLIAGLQWFILIPRLNHYTGSHRPSDSHSKPRKTTAQPIHHYTTSCQARKSTVGNFNPFLHRYSF